jgi:hypothetical protein
MFTAPGFRILGISLAFLFFIKWKSFDERAGLLKPYYRGVARRRLSSTVSLHFCHLSSEWSGDPDTVRSAFSRLSPDESARICWRERIE